MTIQYPLRDTGFRIEVVPLSTGISGIKFIYPEVSFLFPEPEEWLSVLKRALLELKDMNEVQLRVERSKFLEFIPQLSKLGFKKKHDRIEFYRPVNDLPFETGTPIIWHIENDLEKAAKALHEVAQGDPDYDPNEDAKAALQYYFNDPRFISDPECLQLGFVEGKLAALVVAQVRPDGWSRITYMGVHPEFRGKGLGKWVHRRGFAIMKRLGGKNYFGGTVSTNHNMVKLFQEHGCFENRILEEWLWAPKK